MEITDPIIFHVNQGKDLSLKQLKEMSFGETWQKDYLERYKKI